MKNVEIETIKRVYINNNGVFIEIAPDTDVGTAIEIRTTNEASEQWFGQIRLVLDKEFALKLAQALKEMAE